jgi:hypothetical protein
MLDDRHRKAFLGRPTGLLGRLVIFGAIRLGSGASCYSPRVLNAQSVAGMCGWRGSALALVATVGRRHAPEVAAGQPAILSSIDSVPLEPYGHGDG